MPIFGSNQEDDKAILTNFKGSENQIKQVKENEEERRKKKEVNNFQARGKRRKKSNVDEKDGLSARSRKSSYLAKPLMLSVIVTPQILLIKYKNRQGREFRKQIKGICSYAKDGCDYFQF